MNYEDLNGLNFVAAGIYNAYLMTPTIEKHCIICGPEFVSENCHGETASGRSREARARQIAPAGNHKYKTRARLKKRTQKQKARRQSNKSTVKLKLSSQASESYSLSLRSAGLTRAASS